MKIKTNIFAGTIMLLLGTGIFYYLFEYPIAYFNLNSDWKIRLAMAIAVAIIWTAISFVLFNKDKFKKAKKSSPKQIKEAVTHFLDKKYDKVKT